VRVLDRWSSLSDQNTVAQELFGSVTGQRRVAEWLTAQTDLVDDMDFAQEFADHVGLPGVAAADYAHRIVGTTQGELLGGIRFYGRDIRRPFVDVLAHNFDDIDALKACVTREWSHFGIRHLRLRTRPGLLATRPDVILDQSIHVARYRDMAPADGRVTLDRFGSAEEAIQLVAARYRRLAAEDSALFANISQADPDDLHDWHGRDQLRAITLQGNVIGAIAIAPGAIDWIVGDEINEEVISVPYAGHGYAASAQCAWAHLHAAYPDCLLVGTIDRHNHASRATAVRAGRTRVLDDVFVVASAANSGPPRPAKVTRASRARS
jgi:hypothetical protein